MSLKVLLVDDEEQSLELLAIYIEETPGIELIGTETDSRTAYDKLRDNVYIPDVIYLDIVMPIIDGIAFMELIKDMHILVVLISGNHSYGPVSYDYDVVDYLSKIIVKDRFLKSIDKVKERLGVSPEIKIGIDAGILTIPGDGKSDFYFLKLDDILYFDAVNTYSRVFMLDGREYLCNYKLMRVDLLLASKHFMRVHKSHIVNLKQMKQVTVDTIILVNNKEISIGETYKNKFFRVIKPD